MLNGQLSPVKHQYPILMTLLICTYILAMMISNRNVVVAVTVISPTLKL
jgi:hypothetical protein